MKFIRLVALLAVLGAVWAGWECSDSPTKPTTPDVPGDTVTGPPVDTTINPGDTGTVPPVDTTVNPGDTVTVPPVDTIVDPVGPGAWDPAWSCPANVLADGLDLTKDNLGLNSADYVIIKFNNGAAPEITYSEPSDSNHTVTGEHVSLKVLSYFGANEIPYNIIVTGTAKDGSLAVRDEQQIGYKKTLYLNGADITNPSGPAINIQSNKRTDVHLVGSCDRRNKLTGKGKEPDGVTQAKGALFAEGSLAFVGSGSLEIRSKDKHAVVSDEFIEIESGNIIVYESPGDGLHANERITIKGGTLQIKCEGDAIQNERGTAGKDKTPCPITISGGNVKIRTTGTKGHGIVSDSNDVLINGDATNINITLLGNGSKGIRSHGDVKIGGGTVYLEAYGARESLSDDTSSAAGIKADGDVEITRGIITVKSERKNENGKGLNIDGNLKISGGTVTITSDGDAVRVRGSITMSNGTLNAKSTNKNDIDCDGKLNQTGGTLIAENIKKGN